MNDRADATEKQSGAQWKPRARKPELIKVTERIFCAADYAISNVGFVITENGVVVVDTTESPKVAQRVFDEFRKICRLPVSHIIYTHFHDDHVRGASVFHEPSTKIIAQRRMPEEREKLEKLLPYRTRANALQFGATLDGEARGVSLAYQTARPDPSLAQPGDPGGYIAPDVLFDEEYRFEQGGVAFRLNHTEGETVDHLMIWLPREKALFCGDLFYSGFPMLNNPLKPDRPVLAWAQSIERMRAFRAEYFVPSHSRPRRGAEKIDAVLGNYAQAIRHVHDETICCINEGLSLDETRRRVTLPEALAKLPYLNEGYGKIEWAVTSVYRQNTGWLPINPQLDPADLKTSPAGVLESEIIAACCGPPPLVSRAREAMQAGRWQLVLELTGIVLAARPQNAPARQLRIAALRELAARARNGVERNLYAAAAAALAQESRHVRENRPLPASAPATTFKT
jgi:alkyl sulfatase BDS1-like metallo-beta-lactamase superfamily hydrolase